MPLARRFFRPEKEYLYYGGGLLNSVLFGIVTNFRPGDAWDDRVMARLCSSEERLTDAGVIEPDFRIFIGARTSEAPAG